MTPRTWAERYIDNKLPPGMGGPLVSRKNAAKFMEREHARAVRIIKRQIKIAEALRDKNPGDLWWPGYINACTDLITLFQQGRTPTRTGGKG